MSGNYMQVDGSVVDCGPDIRERVHYLLHSIRSVSRQAWVKRIIAICRVTRAGGNAAAHIIELNKHVLAIARCSCSREIHPAGGRIPPRAGALIDRGIAVSLVRLPHI